MYIRINITTLQTKQVRSLYVAKILFFLSFIKVMNKKEIYCKISNSFFYFSYCSITMSFRVMQYEAYTPTISGVYQVLKHHPPLHIFNADIIQ